MIPAPAPEGSTLRAQKRLKLVTPTSCFWGLHKVQCNSERKRGFWQDSSYKAKDTGRGFRKPSRLWMDFPHTRSAVLCSFLIWETGTMHLSNLKGLLRIKWDDDEGPLQTLKVLFLVIFQHFQYRCYFTTHAWLSRVFSDGLIFTLPLTFRDSNLLNIISAVSPSASVDNTKLGASWCSLFCQNLPFSLSLSLSIILVMLCFAN